MVTQYANFLYDSHRYNATPCNSFISRILLSRFNQTLFFILFILIWFVAMSWNMYMGIQAGYAVKEEFLIFLLNFGIPSLLATYFIYKK